MKSIGAKIGYQLLKYLVEKYPNISLEVKCNNDELLLQLYECFDLKK